MGKKTGNDVFRPMRRFKQQMTVEDCVVLLQRVKRGVLAVLGDGGYPYTVPMDFVYNDGHLYFHCAKEGHKLDAIRSCDKASFCVLGEGVKEPDSWWLHFESVVCFGRVYVVEEASRTDALLRLLGAKYFPQGYDMEADMSKNAPNALVLDLQIEHLSGKRVREK
jgi:nitroimidazol reductase NimA-like FMN-containing flavoprotein (pyridoxamine 5'-phosphate oxidase superfamily)